MASNLTIQGTSSDENPTVLVPITEWTQQLGTVGKDTSNGVTTDGEGNVYVSGTTEGDLAGTNAGGKDAWVAKYDPTGTRLWVRQWGSADDDLPGEVAVDSSGNVYMVGSSGNQNFIVKYDNSGNQAWVETLELSAFVNQIAVDSVGDVYIAGGAMLIKYDSSGNQLWLQEEENVQYVLYRDIKIDSADNLFVPRDRFLAQPNTSPSLLKYDKNGNLLDSQNLATTTGLINSIEIDNESNVYSLAVAQENYGSTGKIALYKNESEWLQLKETNQAGTQTLYLGRNDEDNLYALIKDNVEDLTGKEFYFAKYNETGALVWEHDFNPEFSYSGITVGGDGKVYMVGTSEGVISEANGGAEAWITKLDFDTAVVNVIKNGLTLDEGASSGIASSQLKLTNTEDSSYIITALPANGNLKLGNTEVAINDTLTQADVNAGNFSYTHDGSETANDSFSFSATDSNGGEIDRTVFSININPVNDAPTDIGLSNQRLTDSSANGSLIGILTTLDADKNDTHTYTLVDDAEGRFALEGDRLMVADETSINYNDAPSHTVRIRTTDNGSPNLSLEEDFNISVIGESGEPPQEWMQQLTTVGNDEVADVAFDEQGNVYVSGTTEGDLAGTNAGGKDAWVAKYDPTGTRLWVQQWGTVGDDSPAEVAVDGDGNAYIVGQSRRFSENFRDTETDGFIVKYDSSGNRGWVQQVATDVYDSADRVAVDNAGNIYVAGTAGDLGVGAFENSMSDNGPFLAKYGPNGDRLWLKQEANAFGVVDYLYQNLTTDGEDNVYLAKKIGYWEGSPRTAIIKYDSSGNEEWNQNLELQTNNSTEGLVSNGIAVDSAKNIYISGNTEYAYWNDYGKSTRSTLTKLDSNGNQQWQNIWSGSTQGVALDREGNAYVPVPQGINKYDPEGNLLSEQQFLSTFSSYSDIELDGDGRAYLAGGELEPWLAKLDLNIGESAIASQGLTLDEGASFTITTSQLQVTDTEDGNTPTYVIGTLPSHGSLQLNNTEITLDDTFTQADIDAGNLTYIHDGSETTKDNFSFTLAEATVDYGLGVEGLNTGFPITVNPVNDAPIDIFLIENRIAENSDAGEFITQLITTDNDSDTHTYSLIDDAEGRFVIEGNQLKVADSSKLDFEAATSHTIKVRTTDNGEPVQSFEKELVIAVTDVEDNTVTSTTNHRLGATKENLNLVGEDAINAIGNNLDNRIDGNDAKNRLNGKEGNDVLISRGGNDVLIGNEGSDRLIGNQGNDLLNGGPGIDTMNGGPNNDTYIVNHTRDVVKEGRNRGTDIVKSSADYNLGANLENLNLVGRGAINGIGNNLDNRIIGNNAKNRIIGKAGNDLLIGRGGNDVLIGDKGSDRLIGNQGNDLLNGDVGNDTLIGGGGSDRFIFNTGKSYRQAAPGRDVIRDFKNGDNDRIILDKTTFGALDSKAGRGFSVIAEFEVVNRNAAVAGSDAVIVYNENNGKLFYNANGSKSGLGAGGVFAVIDNSTQLEANDFIVRT